MSNIFIRSIALGAGWLLLLVVLSYFGISAALELAIYSSIPTIYAVGPLSNLLPYSWIEGPSGGVLVIIVSSWLTWVLLFLAVSYAWRFYLNRASGGG